MTSEQWIAQARANSAALSGLIAIYHPSSVERRQPRYPDSEFPITAHTPESACNFSRDQIRESESELLVSPVDRFTDALERGDISDIMSLLSSAWFGVPESTSAWRIPGFKEAVDLLEDPPEDLGYGYEDEDEVEPEDEKGTL